MRKSQLPPENMNRPINAFQTVGEPKTTAGLTGGTSL